MKLFSIWSIIFIFLSLLSFGLNMLLEVYFEPIALIAGIFLLIGFILSFIAITKKEDGKIKFISIASFFIILFLLTWFEPFQVVRIMTWLKNIS
ncbi:hypothetical protein A9C19_17915 [Bacillus weihaiensis]|uniref:Uncharacterized protein n=2 Tax=Bacillus weihaiensis TaxID=1547283 RepID=A0A1L3MVT4_9BACI|nr:hypothetical protein [Bacillus weihaiensis]APH06456.1 hypothetical protein A9C19_17915 [Bacillus weihaiensis]